MLLEPGASGLGCDWTVGDVTREHALGALDLARVLRGQPVVRVHEQREEPERLCGKDDLVPPVPRDVSDGGVAHVGVGPVHVAERSQGHRLESERAVVAQEEEVAKTTFKDVYAAIKERLGRDPKGKQAVEEFEADPTKGAADLERALTERLKTDAELVRLLATALEESGTYETGSLVGKIEAERVVVAKKIDTVNM